MALTEQIIFHESPIDTIVERIEALRKRVALATDANHKKLLGQYFTPMSVARFMTTLFPNAGGKQVTLLEPAAGIGSLLVASVAHYVQSGDQPKSLHIIAYEIDGVLLPYLRQSLLLCETLAATTNMPLTYELRERDFIEDAADHVASNLFSQASFPPIDTAILNPPSYKIQAKSRYRYCLERIGLPTSNIYTGFLYTTMQLLAAQGSMVALTPRSFCNGPYFRSFRKALLHDMTLRQVHVFASRKTTFHDDDVLQEHVITSAQKASPSGHVTLSASCADFQHFHHYTAKYTDVVHPADPEQFVHIPASEADASMAILALSTRLSDLAITVSTGRVVDFRARAYLRTLPEPDTLPLIYPDHIRSPVLEWPKPQGKKANALLDVEQTKKLFIPNENYVLVKRFSAKEEARRIKAFFYQQQSVPGERIGVENHLNYFHQHGRGIPMPLAKGLAVYLNSTVVDQYFRQFNGHTQVNATDLRNMPYPSYTQLVALGCRIAESHLIEQAQIDALVQQEVFG